MALISVIIGTYNRSSLLLRAVNSVLKQTYHEIEIIIVNDASTDDTEETIKRIDDSRIIYIRHNENKGIAAVSNTGFSYSSGDYIALLGDDDEWLDRDKIKKQLNCFESTNRKLGIVATWWEEDNGFDVIKKKPKAPKNWQERVLMGGGIICGSTVLINRKAWEMVNGFDENQKRGTDSDLFRKIVLSGHEVLIIKDVSTRVYIAHEGKRMTQLDSVASLDTHIEMLKYNIEKLRDHYSSHPKALSRYYENIASSYWKTYLITNETYRLFNSRSYYLKAFRLWPIRLKSGIKYLLTYFLIFKK